MQESLLISFEFSEYLLQEGVYILTEGEDLNESSKFYILEEGKISCYRNIMVGLLPDIPINGKFIGNSRVILH